MVIITGEAINQIYPIDATLQVLIAVPLLPIITMGAFLSVVCLIAVIKDNHYQDPNYLLAISLIMSDLLHSASAMYAASATLQHGVFNRGVSGCFVETFVIIVSFAGSGMSFVLMSVDRYLQLCHGYDKSWSMTFMLQLVLWVIAIVFPSLALFTSGLDMGDSMMLAGNGLFCLPNFATGNTSLRVWLTMGVIMILLAFVVIVYCYSSIFLMYISKKRRGKKPTRSILDKNSRKLLFKFALITSSFYFFFTPCLALFIYILATGKDVSWQILYTFALFYQFCPLCNPLLQYFMDARLRMSMNDIFPALKFLIKLEFKSRKRPPPILLQSSAASNVKRADGSGGTGTDCKKGNFEEIPVDPLICATVKMDV